MGRRVFALVFSQNVKNGNKNVGMPVVIGVDDGSILAMVFS